jgi:hypothetical protein
MPTTSCEISGKVYQLDYTKMVSKEGSTISEKYIATRLWVLLSPH